MPNRVVHFEIQADDVGRAKKFYESAFGWKVIHAMKKAEGGMMDYWTIMTGKDGEPGINGGLYERPADRKLTTFDCTIGVEDLDAAIQAVEKNGGKIRQKKDMIPGIGWFAGAVDTEGNIFGMLQPTEEMMNRKEA